MSLFGRVFIAAALLAAVGCGGGSSDAPKPADLGGDDGKQIGELVDQMNDDSGRAAKLKGLFAAGSAAGAKEAKAFAQHQYNLKGKPTVSGTTATATVAIEKASGGTAVEKEWAFVKEGDKWKIKSAPLP